MIQKWFNKLRKKTHENNQNQPQQQLQIPDMEYYFITGRIKEKYGGMTKSLLLRANLFGLKNISTHFLTFSYDQEFSQKVKGIIDKQIVDPNMTKIQNMYDDFLIPNCKPKEQYQPVYHADNINKVTCVKEGLSVRYTRHEKSNRIEKVDYFHPNQQLEKREEYNSQGQLHKVSYFSQDTGTVYRELFIYENTNIYMKKEYAELKEEAKSKLREITWYAQEGIKTFKNEKALRQEWLTTIQYKNDRKKLFLVDSRKQDKYVFQLKKRSSSYFSAIIHSKHYETEKAELRSDYNELFSQIRKQKVDAVFFITEEQKIDVVKQFGHQNIFFLTPHTLDRSAHQVQDHFTADPNKVLMMARLTKIKNVIDAIRSFEFVIKEVPNARLEIFGSGPQEKQLKEEIKRLNLEKSVFLKGFTQNPDAEFRTARMSVSTSVFEGCPLSIMESIVNNCPVITYNYDYGASTLVKNQYNGFVVEQYEVKQLAEKIIELLKNDEQYQIFSENCQEIAEVYSTSNYYENWITALHKMIKVREKRDQIQRMMKPIQIKLVEMSVEHHVLSLDLQMEGAIEKRKKVIFELVGYDRRNHAELFSKKVENLKVSFPIGHASIQAALKRNKTKYVDFYIRMRDEEYSGIIKRLPIAEHLLNENDVSKVDGVSYKTIKGNYSWKVN
ncbi:putative poly(glycerol-phosphate) alpha-glucosyltransferase [Bacillus safensis]|uniref:glycosyltransferase n=1 Tax=Bacillus safensis TaxID=561879 RepID=UPI0006A8B9C2|nr:alpha-glucosyltransferase N-terminal domain-containing protein [Bacillus safensis]CUB16621.1 putative poly(glycerol-phosphate) alpha-glucosyltransferase [Bacillus safensis]